MLEDRYGLGLSTTSQAARDAYVEGVDLFLSANFGSEAAFERAIAADEGFALAHAALGRTRQLYSRAEAARQSIARSRALAGGLGRQERANVEILATLVDGNGPAPLPFALEHLAEFPRDVMVLAPCAGVFGLIGFSGRKGRELEQVAQLDALAGVYGDDWWFLSSHAFALGEVGRLAQARRAIDRAQEIYPRNAHGAHVYAHVLYESGEDAAGLAYLEGWLPGLPREAQLHCHLSWHVALWNFDLGNIEAARRVYAADVKPGAAWGPAINSLTDSASLLWRMQLAGQPVDAAQWREVRDYALREFPKAGITFVDVHTALACAAAGDPERLQVLVTQLREREAAGKLAAGPLVPALAEAFGAYVRGDWPATIGYIEPVLGEHERIGGSRAQRDLVEYTLASALVKAGRQPQGPLRRRGGRGALLRAAAP
jgi:tetratricopeptide (TPR) repeat protein